MIQGVRYVLGRIILFVDWATSPKSLVRSESDQQEVDQRLANYKLYELLACPFCVKVRRECKRLGLEITRVNVKTQEGAIQELEEEAGRYQVPCLRIESLDGSVQWVFESNDIIEHLRAEFLPKTVTD